MAVDRTADLTPNLQQRLNTDIGYHQGVIAKWDAQTGSNIIDMAGTPLTDLPMLNITEALVLKPGMVVGLLRFKQTYFILGRIVIPNQPDFFSGVMPNMTTTLWPINSDAALQNNTVDSKWYPKWVGGFVVNHPALAFGAALTMNAAGVTGNWRLQWYPNRVNNTPDPSGGTLIFESDLVTGLSPYETGEYIWPVGLRGSLVYLSFEVRLTAAGAPGTDWIGVLPAYLYGHG